MPEAGEAGFPVVIPQTADAIAEIDALRRSIVDAAWEAADAAPVDLLALNETIPRAELVAWLRRAQAERDAMQLAEMNAESALTRAQFKIEALERQARELGDPSEPLTVARQLLARVELHEFAEGLALIAEARAWTMLDHT